MEPLSWMLVTARESPLCLSRLALVRESRIRFHDLFYRVVLNWCPSCLEALSGRFSRFGEGPGLIGVIEDVVSKVSEDFVNSEAGEEVLNELQATSLQTPVPTSLHSDQGTYNLGTGQSNYMLSPISDCKNSPNDEIWRHNPYMQHYLLTNTQQALGVDVNVAHEENHDHEDIGDSNQPLAQDFFMMASRKRKRYDSPAPVSLGCQMLEQDGSGDVTIEFILPKISPHTWKVIRKVYP